MEDIISLRREDYPEQIALEQLDQSHLPVIVLKINKSYEIRLNDKTIDRSEFTHNSHLVVECAQESWRSTTNKLGKAKLILATLTLGPDATQRGIVGVFEYDYVEKDETPDEKGYTRAHFYGVRPADPDLTERYLRKRLVGFNPRATNPIRYFAMSSKKKNQSNKSL
ncbi:MAG: hypothetical protein K2K79_02240 [Paramuribaculum sp.]|nr:hypothetical protein [Paramuribaculum sp.]